MPRRKHPRNIEDGTHEIFLKSWNEFHEKVGQIQRYPHYVFRGQQDAAWLVEPSLTRLLGKKTKWNQVMKNYLQRFCLSLRGRLDTHLLLTLPENEILAIGQHYGLATPLLDWTIAPYVALFFAFEHKDHPNQTEYRAVYALDEQHVTSTSMSLKPKDKIEFIRPSSGFNQRLVNQNGLFTKSPPFIDIGSWVEDQFESVDDSDIFIKINIPNSDRKTCLQALNRMNINNASLFPDINGSSRFCNMAMEIENY
ncbi:MAG: FRG domain-containing protein [Nitrospira sp.]